MLLNAYIHHELPFRLRLYIPSKKGDDEFFNGLNLELSKCSEVDGVKVNAKTGSVVIYYHGEKAKIVEFAKHKNLFLLHDKPSIGSKKHHSPAKRLFTNINVLNHKIAEQSEGQIDLSFITACGLVGLALFQTKNSRILPPAWTLVSQALSLLHFSAGGHFTEFLSNFDEENSD